MAVADRLPVTSGLLAPGFRHSALIVESDRSVRQLLVPAVRQVLAEAGEVFMAVSSATADVLRAELGPAADTLEWGNGTGRCQRMGFAYEGFRRFLAAAHDAGRRVHVFAEPDPGPITDNTGADGTGAADRVSAYLLYEAMCNETYAGYGCPVNCLWDARRYPAPVIEAVRAVHGYELRADGGQPSAGYVMPRDFLAERDRLPLAPPAVTDWELTFNGVDDLPALRRQLRDWARARAFGPSASSDVILAVNEIATNGLTHGAPPVTVRAWSRQDTLIVQVEDRGGRELPALGGYQPPDEKQDRTRGLWLARQLADVVQAHTDGGTTAVRLHFPYRLTHQRPAYLGGEAG